ncbi:hypothetical protein [Synechocystis sp. LKSZ1]|uniref:hypothetical protein n=1 Tax=Synechocystis sp. LKSZ1 TaxID=3144951 RepID=UPI00336C2EF3
MGFPSFKDWLRTFWLLLLTGIYLTVGRLTVIPLVMMIGLHVLTEQWAFGLLGLVSFLVIFPVVYYTLIHYFLWGKHDPALPQWFPSWPSWREGLWQYLTGLVLLITLITMAALLVVATNDYLTKEQIREMGETIVPVIIVLWLFLASQIYRWRRLGASWWQNNRRKWFRWPKKKTPAE